MEEKDPNPPPVPVASAPARDTTHLAIVKPGTPIVCLDELGEQSAACPGGLHMDKAGLDLEICRNARICRQGQMPDSARERDSAKSAVNYSRVRIEMLANSEAIAVTFQNVWIAQCLPYRKEDRADASLPRLATRQLNAPSTKRCARFASKLKRMNAARYSSCTPSSRSTAPCIRTATLERVEAIQPLVNTGAYRVGSCADIGTD